MADRPHLVIALPVGKSDDLVLQSFFGRLTIAVPSAPEINFREASDRLTDALPGTYSDGQAQFPKWKTRIWSPRTYGMYQEPGIEERRVELVGIPPALFSEGVRIGMENFDKFRPNRSNLEGVPLAPFGMSAYLYLAHHAPRVTYSEDICYAVNALGDRTVRDLWSSFARCAKAVGENPTEIIERTEEQSLIESFARFTPEVSPPPGDENFL
jgi:hypothetical protein